VNGPALAGGFEIVLACDLVVSVESARFGIPEVKRGLMAAAGGLIRLPKRVPLAIALELAMTGDPIDAQRALQLGLVNRVVAADRLLDEAIALAERIGENSPAAVRASRQLVREAAELTEEQGWKRTIELMMPVFESGDAIEGATAFAEKRSPVWRST
jgi:enoyl-CoA hydratase